MILYETINTKRVPADELCSSDELYSSETLALMPLASCCFPEDSTYSPENSWQYVGEREDDCPPYPFFAFGDEDDDDDIDEDDTFDDDLDDDFDDDFDDDYDDYDDDDDGYDYEEDIEYDDFDE